MTGRFPMLCTTLAVRLEMILLVRLRLGGQIEELGAVQADPVGPAVDAMVDLVRKLDVPEQIDPHAVLGFGGQVAAAFPDAPPGSRSSSASWR